MERGGRGDCLSHHWNTGQKPNTQRINKSFEDVAMFKFLKINYPYKIYLEYTPK
jgi:hypothetical protein